LQIKAQEWDSVLIKTYNEEIQAINKLLNRRIYKMSGYNGEDLLQDMHYSLQLHEFMLFDYRKYIQPYKTAKAEKNGESDRWDD
jgi:hypothetical protein